MVRHKIPVRERPYGPRPIIYRSDCRGIEYPWVAVLPGDGLHAFTMWGGTLLAVFKTHAEAVAAVDAALRA